MRIKTALIALSTAFLINGASAHHGSVTNGSLYRVEELIQLEGEITEVFWHNPHVRGKMKVENSNGNAETWEVEFAGGPRSWERRGMVADDFLGSVKVAGHVSRRNPRSLQRAADLADRDSGADHHIGNGMGIYFKSG